MKWITKTSTSYSPKDGEKYWYFDRGKDGYVKTEYIIFCGCRSVFVIINVGNCFKTEAEAEENKYSVYEKIMFLTEEEFEEYESTIEIIRVF